MKKKKTLERIIAAVLLLNLAVTVNYLVGNPRSKESKALKSLIGRSIVLPDSINADEMAVMVVWYDSATCATCFMNRIGEWVGLLEECDSIDGFKPIFIFSPLQQDSIKYEHARMKAGLPYPVISDYKRRFTVDNPGIPAETTLHTFLLDGQRKIVLAGNPQGHQKLWELYLKYIKALTTNNGRLPDDFVESIGR